MFRTALAGLLVLGLNLPAQAGEEEQLYQVSTIDALMVGLYDGVVDFAQLKRHGDFGIGTLHGLDGELIGLEGGFWQVTADGKVHPVPDQATTPFATVSFFRPELELPLAGMEMAAVEAAISERAGSENFPYAIRIDGLFERVRTRSVPAQSPPYPPLPEVAKRQSVFEFEAVRGTVVGYRLPPWFARFNAPGYHLHFLTEDRKAGGHVLDLKVREALARVDPLGDFHAHLPQTDPFRAADLRGDRSKALYGVEKR